MLDSDHNQRLNTKVLYKLHLRKTKTCFGKETKDRLNKLCPTLGLHLSADVTNMIDALTIQQFQHIAPLLSYASINLISSRYTYFGFMYDDYVYISYSLSMTVPSISKIDQIGENSRILAMKTFSEEKNKAQ